MQTRIHSLCTALALIALALAPLPCGASGVADPDTLYLLGGPDRDDGDFQDAAGLPDPEGWFGVSEGTGPSGPCSFARVWPLLDDLDPDHDNDTPQFAFVNDGLACPGIPASPGTTWTYGPGGFVTYYAPGYASDAIWSPRIAWADASMDGAILAYDTYDHSEPPVHFTTWNVRFSTDGGGTWTEWRNYSFVYFANEPSYVRREIDLTDLVEPGCTHVQISLHFLRIAVPALDPTPAPYFDNVSLRIFSQTDTGAPPAAPAARLDINPNPFNPRTVFALALPAAGPVEVSMYNLRGQRVKTLFAGDLPAGDHELVWHGDDDTGRRLESGVYLARLSTDEGEVVRKVSITK